MEEDMQEIVDCAVFKTQGVFSFPEMTSDSEVLILGAGYQRLAVHVLLMAVYTFVHIYCILAPVTSWFHY